MRAQRVLSFILAAAMIHVPATLAPASASAPQQPSPAPETPVFRAETTTVLVDVVVRDKKGHPVRGLTASDFEIYEEGVKQVVDSFRVVDNLGAEATAAEGTVATAPDGGLTVTPSPSTPKHTEAPSVLAFVFDRLSPNARAVAKKAALAYTDGSHVAGDLVGVFAVDLALRTLQPFTNDVERVRLGLELAALQANTAFASDREEARRREESADRLAETLAGLGGGGAGGGGNPGAVAGVFATQLAADQMQANILRAFDAMERDQQGFATTHGLLAVVNGLKPIPGRKTVVFFSEGIAIPASVEGQFRSVIAAANRANVSVYPIDAAGLRVTSGASEARDEVMRNAQARLRQEEAAGSGRPTRDAMSRGMERNEEALRLNPESGLGQLADDTGGFLVRDTNDLRSGFGRIAEDMRFYYVLSYAPTNDRMDGRFRTISVKVRPAGLRVQSRKGYFAVRPDVVLPVQAYEAPALALLDASPRPDAFPIGMDALSFPETAHPGLAPVLVGIPAGGVSWAPQPGSGFRADFTVVVRIKDSRGHEADRLSQDYKLSVVADKLEGARRGDILFYREASIPPGRYTAEAVAYDAIARTASVRTEAFEVASAEGDRLRLSSLVLVSRAEKLTAAEQKERKPLHFGEVYLYPSLGAPFKKSAVPALGYFFSVYGKDTPTTRTATIEVQEGSRTLVRSPSALAPPDAEGRIQHAGTLPLRSFKPGSYTLRVSIGEGGSVQTREARFTVVD
jgi:VWFA-related protein